MTLEWLLIVSAIAGLAAGTVLAVQQVLDTSTEIPARSDEVLIIDAEIAAASAADAASCNAIARDFGDVVSSARWTPAAQGPPATPTKCTLARR